MLLTNLFEKNILLIIASSGNILGSTLLDNPYSMTSMTKGKAPGQAKKITKNQLKKFNKKMKALRVAKLSPEEKKGKRKNSRKNIRAS